jgi:hypothetical protein
LQSIRYAAPLPGVPNEWTNERQWHLGSLRRSRLHWEPKQIQRVHTVLTAAPYTMKCSQGIDSSNWVLACAVQFYQ